MDATSQRCLPSPHERARDAIPCATHERERTGDPPMGIAKRDRGHGSGTPDRADGMLQALHRSGADCHGWRGLGSG
jgi:hypothetical protein